MRCRRRGRRGRRCVIGIMRELTSQYEQQAAADGRALRQRTFMQIANAKPHTRFG